MDPLLDALAFLGLAFSFVFSLILIHEWPQPLDEAGGDYSDADSRTAALVDHIIEAE